MLVHDIQDFRYEASIAISSGVWLKGSKSEILSAYNKRLTNITDLLDRVDILIERHGIHDAVEQQLIDLKNKLRNRKKILEKERDTVNSTLAEKVETETK